MIDAASTDQAKIGILPQLIPGARCVMIVAMKFIPPRIDEIPNVKNASSNNKAPIGP